MVILGGPGVWLRFICFIASLISVWLISSTRSERDTGSYVAFTATYKIFDPVRQYLLRFIQKVDAYFNVANSK